MQQGPDFIFLHIGKTGGTALRAVVEHHDLAPADIRWAMLNHNDTLRSAMEKYPQSRIGFFCREPMERFISGFLSRQRRGRPRYDSAWTEAEAAAFTRFDTVEKLGLGLANQSTDAVAAVNAIFHTRNGLRFYLHDVATLDSLADRIFFLGRVDAFDADIERLKACLGIAPVVLPPSDDVGAHRNPADADRELSTAARNAIRGWLAEDYRIYAWCLKKRAELVSR